MDFLHAWFDAQGRTRLRLVVAGAVAASLVAGALAAALGHQRISPWIGAVAGVLLYGAVRALLLVHGSSRTQARLVWKAVTPPRRRRLVVAVVALLWAAAMVATAPMVPALVYTLLGAIQVALLLVAVNLVILSPEDAVWRQAVEGDEDTTVGRTPAG